MASGGEVGKAGEAGEAGDRGETGVERPVPGEDGDHGETGSERPVPGDADSAVDDPPLADEDDVVPDGPLDVDHATVIVVGFDAWTGPVLEELLARENRVTVLVADRGVADRLRERALDVDVTCTPELDEAAFAAAGLADADAVYVATLDDQHNVLAVLTVMSVDETVDVATFAREAADVPKLRAAGADVVIPLGEVVGELLVEVALTDRSVDDVLRELTRRA